MAYQVLARKWRPQNFSQLVGQEHVSKSLINALQHQRLHHAYLFTGTRGCGKTTIARILAKAINCLNLQDYNPCGQCAICRDFDSGRFMDLIEVDAASRTKVEDTRDLLDNAQYAPNQGKYKVYLIDEVHMLSGHSFNALLKTLEEPPEHVKFLLATTDPHKIPVTVLSRCLQFNLKRLLPEQISKQMAFILQQEQIEFDQEALALLARAADGSMRDGLSLVDQAIAFGQGRVNKVDVSAMLGTVAQQPVDDLLRGLSNHDGKAILATIAEIAELTPDFSDVLQQMLRVLHRVALLQTLPDYIDQEFDATMLAEFASHIPPEDVQLFYQIGLVGQKDFDLAPDPRTGFEMIMLRMLTFRPVSIENRSSAIPQTKTTQIPQTSPVIAKTITAPPINIPPPQVVPPAQPVYQPPIITAATAPVIPQVPVAGLQWSEIILAMNLKGTTQQLANNCALEHLDAQTCTLLLDPAGLMLKTPRTQENLQAALQNYLHNPSLKLIFNKAQQNVHLTPAMQQQQQRGDRQQAAIDAIHTDPNVIALQEHFNAHVIADTIKPL
jgi:DNA polymerase-3 subunit gamma/tau